jgi:hypothetical protein
MAVVALLEFVHRRAQFLGDWEMDLHIKEINETL